MEQKNHLNIQIKSKYSVNIWKLGKDYSLMRLYFINFLKWNGRLYSHSGLHNAQNLSIPPRTFPPQLQDSQLPFHYTCQGYPLIPDIWHFFQHTDL